MRYRRDNVKVAQWVPDRAPFDLRNVVLLLSLLVLVVLLITGSP